jgi:predicted transcriptional regulator
MIRSMKQILVQLDDRTAARLEEVAPGRGHKRSAFVRRAICSALQEELERRTAEAYAKWPDEPAAFDPAEWAPAPL